MNQLYMYNDIETSPTTRLDIDANLQQKHIDNTDKEILCTSWQTTLLQRISDHDLCADIEWEFSKLNRCIREQNTVNFEQNSDLREMRGEPVKCDLSDWQENVLSRIGSDVVREEVRRSCQASARSVANLSSVLRIQLNEIEELKSQLDIDEKLSTIGDPELVHAVASLDSTRTDRCLCKYGDYIDSDDDEDDDASQKSSRVEPLDILESMSDEQITNALRAVAEGRL